MCQGSYTILISVAGGYSIRNSKAPGSLEAISTCTNSTRVWQAYVSISTATRSRGHFAVTTVLDHTGSTPRIIVSVKRARVSVVDFTAWLTSQTPQMSDKDVLLSMGFDPARVECTRATHPPFMPDYHSHTAFPRGDQGNGRAGPPARHGLHPRERRQARARPLLGPSRGRERRRGRADGRR